MTATATKTRLAPLEDIETAEQAWVQARDHARNIGGELAQKLAQLDALQRERHAVIDRDRELVDYHGAPVDPDNPVGKIDQAIQQLGDLNDLAARVEHERAIEKSRRQSFEDRVRHHGNALEDAYLTRIEASIAKCRELAAAHAAAEEEILAHAHRSMEIAHIRGVDNRGIPLDAIGHRVRAARELADNPPPTPARPR